MSMRPSEAAIGTFHELLWAYYNGAGRHYLPWRMSSADGTFDPYRILVSEIMLQQTQVKRVIPKYTDFMRVFPTVQALAGSELSDVLRVWQGLGYNRRAKYLWLAAQEIQKLGYFPRSVAELTRLPGVGKNTAGAIMVYAFGEPAIFVETNIRTVYVYHFTRDGQIVSDDFIRDLLMRTFDAENPREFYWALMDYGSYLKTTVRNASQSSHYKKQSKFEGSLRQVRGAVIRELGKTKGGLGEAELTALIPDARLQKVIQELVLEGLVVQDGGLYRL